MTISRSINDGKPPVFGPWVGMDLASYSDRQWSGFFLSLRSRLTRAISG
jgi:hypothetical protein